jgi:CRISPR-associated protein Csm4
MTLQENRYVLAKFNFEDNRVHFGGYDDQLGLDGALPHLLADTLFSALCHGWLMCYGQAELESLLKAFRSDCPPWRMSDGFPYLTETTSATAYLPKPVSPLPHPDEKQYSAEVQSSSSFKKKLKKLQFLQAEDITRFLNRELDENSLGDYPTDLWLEATVPHVAVNRGIGDPAPYRVNYLQFLHKKDKASGIWVLFDLGSVNSHWLPKLKEILTMLGETTGIGGRKSTGAGRFILEWSDDDQMAEKLLKNIQNYSGLSFHPGTNDDQILLSITNPTPAEALKLKQPGNARYQLVNRRGFHYSTDPGWPGLVKKKPVAMLLAGSMIKGGIQGRLIDVTPVLQEGNPPHQLYRYGLGLTLGVPKK